MLESKTKCLTYSLFYEVYGNEGARGRASHSKSPAHLHNLSNSYNSLESHNKSLGAYRTDGWNSEHRGSDLQSGHQLDHPFLPQTLEELEMEFTRDATELERIRNKEEDEEIHRHREV